MKYLSSPGASKAGPKRQATPLMPKILLPACLLLIESYGMLIDATPRYPVALPTRCRCVRRINFNSNKRATRESKREKKHIQGRERTPHGDSTRGCVCVCVWGAGVARNRKNWILFPSRRSCGFEDLPKRLDLSRNRLLLLLV